MTTSQAATALFAGSFSQLEHVGERFLELGGHPVPGGIAPGAASTASGALSSPSTRAAPARPA